jgi:hypothetical protein
MDNRFDTPRWVEESSKTLVYFLIIGFVTLGIGFWIIACICPIFLRRMLEGAEEEEQKLTEFLKSHNLYHDESDHPKRVRRRKIAVYVTVTIMFILGWFWVIVAFNPYIN